MLNIYPAGQTVAIERVIFDRNGDLVAIETRTVSNAVARHVHDAVALHHFADAADWARGLDEMAGMSDEQIEAIAR